MTRAEPPSNSNHYGGVFHLAAALDQAGEKGEAKPVWKKMLEMAEAINDKETIQTIPSPYGRPDTVSIATLA